MGCLRSLETWMTGIIVCVDKIDSNLKLNNAYFESKMSTPWNFMWTPISTDKRSTRLHSFHLFPRPTFFLVSFRLVILSSLSLFISRFECLVYSLLDSGGEYIFVVMITRTVRSGGKRSREIRAVVGEFMPFGEIEKSSLYEANLWMRLEDYLLTYLMIISSSPPSPPADLFSIHPAVSKKAIRSSRHDKRTFFALVRELCRRLWPPIPW